MRPVYGIVTLALAPVIASSMPAPARAQACEAGQVALTERAALQLPATFGIAGIAADSAGGLALWSPDGELLRVDGARRLTTGQLPERTVPAGLAFTAEGLRLLDLMTGRDLLLLADGGLREVGRVDVGLSEQIDQALWTGEGWILALRDIAKRQFVLRRAGPQGSQVLYRSAPGRTLKTIPRYRISGGARSVMLVRLTAPFDVLHIESATGRADTLAFPLGDSRAGLVPPDSLPHWRALSVVALDCALLVTLTDLTADRRLLVRYDLDGRVAQVTPVEAPIGLVARLDNSPTILAARRAGELELVWYDWHWIRDPHPSSP